MQCAWPVFSVVVVVCTCLSDCLLMTKMHNKSSLSNKTQRNNNHAGARGAKCVRRTGENKQDKRLETAEMTIEGDPAVKYFVV